MGRLPIQHVECFHLILLRVLEARLERATWVVKGGVNLRAWFGSRRYSADLDVDVIRGQSHVLREKVDKLLASRPFTNLLASQGLSLETSTKPKQTDTTQRWKFEVKAEGLSIPLRTKLEFSRRGTRDEEHILEAVRPDIVRAYGLPAPTVNHYTARSAIRQKVLALASRTEPQARDVWDLDHLLRTAQTDLAPLTPPARKALPAAMDRALSLSFDVFKAQVVAYLAPEDRELYGTPDAWARMRELVVGRLSELVE